MITRNNISMKTDYENFLSEIGLTEWQMNQCKGSVKMDCDPCEKVSINVSQIQGFGVFADEFIAPDEIVAPAFTEKGWTEAGRYANHSPLPNAKLAGNDFLAVKPIKEGEEITVNYRQVKTEMEKS